MGIRAQGWWQHAPPPGSFQSLSVARVGVLFSLLFVVVLQQVFQGAPSAAVLIASYGLLCVGFAFTGATAWLPESRWNLVQTGLHIVFDATLITVWLLISLGRENVFSLLYLIQILAVALTLYQRAALASALLASLAFGLVLGIHTPPSPYLTWGINAGLFLTLGVVGGYLSEELHRTTANLVHLEDQVRQHEKLAAVGQLAAGIAHEIRNPLAGMSASLEMLRSSLPKELVGREDQKLMEIALREVDRLNRLISEFLDYVKPQQLKREPVDLKKVLSEVVFAVQHPKEPGKIQSLKGGYTYRTDIVLKEAYQEVPAVLAHAEKLKQVVWNLVINAFQAMDKPGVVEIGCERVGGAQVKFWVRDEGQGMTEKTLSHLFEPFFTTKEKGTGLGLATAYRIVEAMKGEIAVESRPGQGTVFSIVLPIA